MNRAVRILDTDTCIELLRGNQTVLQKRAAVVDDVVITWITPRTLLRCRRSASPDNNRSLVDEFLMTTERIDMDLKAAQAFGHIKALLQRWRREPAGRRPSYWRDRARSRSNIGHRQCTTFRADAGSASRELESRLIVLTCLRFRHGEVPGVASTLAFRFQIRPRATERMARGFTAPAKLPLSRARRE